MLSNSHSSVRPASEPERAYLESLIRADYERCHPGETIDDMIRRASFSKEDKGLLRDWMAVATMRAAARHLVSPPSMAPNEKFTRSSSDATFTISGSTGCRAGTRSSSDAIRATSSSD